MPIMKSSLLLLVVCGVVSGDGLRGGGGRTLRADDVDNDTPTRIFPKRVMKEMIPEDTHMELEVGGEEFKRLRKDTRIIGGSLTTKGR